MLITNTLSSVHTYLLDCINRFDVLKKKNTLEKVYQKKIKSKLNKEKNYKIRLIEWKNFMYDFNEALATARAQ